MVRRIRTALCVVALTFSSPGITHREIVHQWPSKKEFHCLVQNVYYEARGESQQGKIAVAHVTLNRTRNPKFPKNICEVVYQPGQFSWTQGVPKAKPLAKEWRESYAAAAEAYNTRGFDAIYFHNKESNARWNLKPVKIIGKHHFYKDHNEKQNPKRLPSHENS